MKWNAFNLISPSIEKAKKRLFPFNFKEWFRLAFISGMSGGGSGGNSGGSGNSNINYSPNKDALNQTGMNNITGNAIEGFKQYGGIIGGFVFVFLIILAIFSYIQSVFSFIFVEEVVEKRPIFKKKGFWKKFILLIVVSSLIEVGLFSRYILYIFQNKSLEGIVRAISIPYIVGTIVGMIVLWIAVFIIFLYLLDIPKQFKKNNSKGISLFLFKVGITILWLLVLALLVGPHVYFYFSGTGLNIGTISLSVILLIAFAIFMWFVVMFLYDFVVPYMYSKEVPALLGLKMVWRNIRKNKVETLVYWLARLVVGVILVIIVFIVLIAVMALGALIGGLLFLMGYGLYQVGIGMSILIGIGVILLIILLVVIGIGMSLVILPFGVFSKYFGLLNFEKLTQIKIIKR